MIVFGKALSIRKQDNVIMFLPALFEFRADVEFHFIIVVSSQGRLIGIFHWILTQIGDSLEMPETGRPEIENLQRKFTEDVLNVGRVHEAC